MGLGLLNDAAVRERRRRLLDGADMAPAVKRPRRAQIGVLVVDRERQTHRRLAAAATRQETRAPETLMTGFNTSALRSSAAVAEKTMSATSEAADGLETLIPGQHTALFSSAAATGKFSKVDSQDSDSDGDDAYFCEARF